MHIRTFRAANLQAALADIRQQMGSEAAVLHTRQVRDGWLGWLGRTRVEVVAGLKSPQEEHHAAEATHVSTKLSQRLVSDSEPHAQLERLRQHLFRQGVGDIVVESWLRQATQMATSRAGGSPAKLSYSQLHDALRDVVTDRLECAAPIQAMPGQRRVVALVGPTGVGKTTTLAKLAAGFRIQQKRRVGLLTIDTYRIAAVQQLEAYAQIMDLPMQVVQRPEQMPVALAALGDVDLVLIDTAGRSPQGEARIDQLQQLLAAAQPDETQLVLSATSSAASTNAVLRGFAPVQPTATILTKLDETAQMLGILAAMQQEHATPLTYVTNGQQVPDDIALADAAELARLALPPSAAESLAA